VVDDKNTQGKAKSDDESSAAKEKSDSEEYQTSTLQRIRRYSLRSASRSDPFDIASMANLSYLRRETKTEEDQKGESATTTDTESSN
jgi:hypothetical protein